MKNRAVFLDRDGTINYDSGYIGDPDKVELLDGVKKGIYKLKNEYHFKIVVISNQAGVARGIITEDNVRAVNRRINDLLGKESSVDRFYYCLHHPEHSDPEDVKCRKPSPKMIFDACRDLEIDINTSYLVGDRHSDIECAQNAGLKSVLLTSDVYHDEINILHQDGISANFVAENFLEATDFIINDFSGGNS